MAFSLSFALPSWRSINGAASSLAALIQALFSNGEKGGIWPLDPKYMMKTADGAQPAIGDKILYWLDAKDGATDNLGADAVSNGTFASDTAWTKGTGWTITGGQAVHAGASGDLTQAALTVGTFYKITFVAQADASFTVAAGTATATLASSVSATARTVYLPCLGNTTLKFTMTSGGTLDNVVAQPVPGNHLWQTDTAKQFVYSARYNLLNATATLATQSVTTAATSYTLSFSGTGSVALSGTATATYSAGSQTFTPTAGTLTLTVTGSVTNADLRPTADLVGQPAYQRVTSSTDYDTVGFYPYALASSAGMQSFTTIDLSSSDELTMFVGTTKNSDATDQVIAEFSADATTNNGTFYVGVVAV